MELANTDRDLESLGAAPEPISQLIERYCGARRLTPSAADVLLADLGALPPGYQAARSRKRSSRPAVSESEQRPESGPVPAGSFAPPPMAATSSRPPARSRSSTPAGLGYIASPPPAAPEFTELAGLEPDLDAPGGAFDPFDDARSDAPESPSAMLNGAVSAWSRSWSSAPGPDDEATTTPPPAPSPFAFSQAPPPPAGSRPPLTSSRPPLLASEAPPIFELPEPKDGPLTQRMNARELRTSGRPAFSGGLAGADELPDFPVGRPPQPGKPVDKPVPRSPPAANTQSALPEETDSFEILVDEEILEIEPDDALLEEVKG